MDFFTAMKYVKDNFTIEIEGRFIDKNTLSDLIHVSHKGFYSNNWLLMVQPKRQNMNALEAIKMVYEGKYTFRKGSNGIFVHLFKDEYGHLISSYSADGNYFHTGTGSLTLKKEDWEANDWEEE